MSEHGDAIRRREKADEGQIGEWMGTQELALVPDLSFVNGRPTTKQVVNILKAEQQRRQTAQRMRTPALPAAAEPATPAPAWDVPVLPSEPEESPAPPQRRGWFGRILRFFR